jgi:4-amino-4-deoxy-L-arabinose transferase-like glycosyltransferase
MDHAVQMLKSGSLRPPFFDYPGLVFYLQLPVAGLRLLAGVITGEWTSLAETSASHFYLWSRAFTALLGVGTVFLVYRIGLRWGARHALLAAALLAVMPMHVRESRFVLTDVPMTFFVTLTLLLTLRAYEQHRRFGFAWSGVAVGLGTAVKYTAGVALLVPLVAAWLTTRPRHSRGWSTVAVGGGFVLAFFLGAPYALLDFSGFLDGLSHLAAQYRPRDPADDHAAWIYVKHLILNFHWPAFYLAVLGLVVSAVQLAISRPRLPPALVLLFPVIFVLALGNYSPIFARYVLPVLPFACLAAAVAVFATADVLRRFGARRTIPIVQVAMAALAIVPPAWHSIGYVRAASVVSTQAVAYRWFVKNVPPGAVVVIENGVLRFPSDLYRSVFVRQATDKTLEQYREMGAQYLVKIPKDVPDPADATAQEPGADGDSDSLAGDDADVIEVTSSSSNPGPDLRIIRLSPPR